MLEGEKYEKLAEYEYYIGFKDDVYQIPYRCQIAQKFGDRICIIGGGDIKKYVLCCHLPGQSEFAGFFNPSRQKRIFDLLDANNYREALLLIEQDAENKGYNNIDGLDWVSCMNVAFWAMGFAQSYRIRMPKVEATGLQAGMIVERMRRHRLAYERLEI